MGALTRAALPIGTAAEPLRLSRPTEVQRPPAQAEGLGRFVAVGSGSQCEEAGEDQGAFVVVELHADTNDRSVEYL